jgi:plastocyanin
MAYTTIDDPSANFYTYAFSKSAGTGSVTFDANSDLQPDFLWVKSRSNADSHELWDSTRGVNSTLFSDNTSAEDTAANRIVSFDTDGFTWGNAGNLNAAGDFVSWAWKANGGSTVTNTDGSANSTVQANTDAGFSILEITGTGANATYGHGLGVKPQVVLIKRTSAIGNWLWLTSVIDGTHDYFYLNNPAAQNATSYDLPTSSVFQYNDTSGATSIVYCFAEKQGFSKIGKYVGNGSLTSGPFVYTGFKPAFVMIKATDAIKNWVMLDNKRLGYNGGMYFLYANLTNAEGETPSSGGHIDLLSNGFKIYDNWTLTNQNTVNYIYMAFAENPFVTSTGIPTPAR